MGSRPGWYCEPQIGLHCAREPPGYETSKDQVSRAEKLEDLCKTLAIQRRFLLAGKKGRWHSLKLATRSEGNRGEVNFLGRFYPLLRIVLPATMKLNVPSNFFIPPPLPSATNSAPFGQYLSVFSLTFSLDGFIGIIGYDAIQFRYVLWRITVYYVII